MNRKFFLQKDLGKSYLHKLVKRNSKLYHTFFGVELLLLLIFFSNLGQPRLVIAQQPASLIGSSSSEACVPPPAGLINWWAGDGNANDIQGSSEGALVGGTTFAPGKVAQAFKFDGQDDQVQAPDNEAWAFG